MFKAFVHDDGRISWSGRILIALFVIWAILALVALTLTASLSLAFVANLEYIDDVDWNGLHEALIEDEITFGALVFLLTYFVPFVYTTLCYLVLYFVSDLALAYGNTTSRTRIVGQVVVATLVATAYIWTVVL